MENIKNDVRACLKKIGEATVKQIVKATGHSDTEVINALNALRTYAEVECAKGGRGKGMTYWLTKGDEPVVTKTAVDPKPEYNPDSVAFGKGQDAIKSLREENAALKVEVEDYERIVSVMRSALGIKDGDSIKLAIEKLQSDLGHARIQIDAMNEQLMAGDGEEAVDVAEAAKGYLVCAPKRKPAKLMTAASAVARAKSAAKAAGRSEVFALVPVGVATRKRLMAVEFKERSA